MDTSNSTPIMHFLVSELRHSNFGDDRELANQALQTIEALVQVMKPVLPYIIPPHVIHFYAGSVRTCEDRRDCSLRVVPIYDQKRENFSGNYPGLFMNEVGQFIKAEWCDRGHWHRLNIDSNDAWTAFLFDDLIERLQKIFADAETKRERHLASIRERREKLDEIMEVLKKKK